MKVNIVIPTYNEKENIGPMTEEIFRLLPEANILVVDDNSPDGTSSVVEELQNKYPNLSLLKRPRKDGLGGAYIAGFKKLFAEGAPDLIITMDADFSHHPRYIPSLIQAAVKSDLVIGSRYIKGGGIAEWEIWRRLLSKGANLYVRMIVGWKVHDWTAGFQCIRASLMKKIDFDTIDLSGYAFLQELKYLLIKAGARVGEVPIIFEARRGGESKISQSIIMEGVTAPWKIRLKK
jgi:dolichol-phosphate mannosyltransferase